MDFNASDAGHRGAARKAFWDTLMEARAEYEARTGEVLGPPVREDVEHQFRQWLSSMGLPAFPFYPTSSRRRP